MLVSTNLFPFKFKSTLPPLLMVATSSDIFSTTITKTYPLQTLCLSYIDLTIHYCLPSVSYQYSQLVYIFFCVLFIVLRCCLFLNICSSHLIWINLSGQTLSDTIKHCFLDVSIIIFIILMFKFNIFSQIWLTSHSVCNVFTCCLTLIGACWACDHA